MSQETEEAVFQLRHGALRNAMYHTARQRRLSGWNRFFNFLTILGGTAVVSQIFQAIPFLSVASGLAIASIGALQLVLDFAGRARTHQQLHRDYTILLAEIDGAETCDPERCARWRGVLTRISTDEPPVLRALMAIADNQATSALREAKKPRLHVPWYRAATAQLLAQDGYGFKENDGWDVD